MTADPDRACLHPDFAAFVDVGRCVADGRPETLDEPAVAFAASIRLECTACGEKFRFMGVEAGDMPDRPMCSVDETELRAPIRPASSDRDFGLGLPGFAVRFHERPRPVGPREMLALRGKTVAVDFDGPLHSYVSGRTGYEPLDPPTEGALEFVQDLYEAGARCVVFSARADSPTGVGAIQRWLARYEFPVMPVTNVKPSSAIAFVDDRAVEHPAGTDWRRTLAKVCELAATTHPGET